MEYADLEQQIKNYVEDLFSSSALEHLYYHNLSHTRHVQTCAMEIASHFPLSEQSIFVLSAAAWFHDTGYLSGTSSGHEEESVHIMRVFFADKTISERAVEMIAECIRATRVPCNPKNILDEIICDADSFHFGTPEFRITDALIKKEVEHESGCCPVNWNTDTLRMLKEHAYFTGYCIEKLQSGKVKNIRSIEYQKTKGDPGNRQNQEITKKEIITSLCVFLVAVILVSLFIYVQS